jgi:hypothetical protein
MHLALCVGEYTIVGATLREAVWNALTTAKRMPLLGILAALKGALRKVVLCFPIGHVKAKKLTRQLHCRVSEGRDSFRTFVPPHPIHETTV